jgi:hypothetical protein
LAPTSQAAFEWINCTLQRNHLTRQEIFTDEVLMGLASCGLEQVDDSHRNLGPAELPARLQSALSGYQPARMRHHNRVEKADIGDAVGQRPQISQVLPVAEANLDLVNGKSWPIH